jgi:aminopeptidase N
MPSLSLAEARARAATATVHHYDVDLDLTGPETFGSTTRIRFSAAAGTFVELAGAVEVRAVLDGAELPAGAYADGRLALDVTGEHELVVAARLPYVTDGDGMHAFTDPGDGARYVSAYCGMDNASRVFACFDQPDLKAPIRLSVTADPAWTVLGNGVGTGEGGRWTFTATPPVPPYLFVVCAGPWHSVRFEHAGLPFGWHAPASLAGELERDAAELRRVTTACFDHYTRVFDEPYAFDSYDQVFVPGLNWGAMENPGCVTYRDEYLTRSEPTAIEQLWRASTIAHEMAHMWFGDLVTMRWWEDSWLNESFADYMGYEVAGAAAGFDRAWVGSALERKPTAYVADARRSTHPVAEDPEAVVDVATAFGNFDMITYAKGNAVLFQLVTWLGEEAFLAGVNAYLSAHPFGNATLQDLLDALDGASDRDTNAWAQAWLRSTGYDTIRVEHVDGTPVLRREGARPHRFRVGGYDDSGALVVARTVDLDAEPLPLPDFAGLAVVPNDREETYARVLLDEPTWATVTGQLGRIEDPLTRAMLWMNAVDRVAAGPLPVSDLVALVGRHLADEPEPMIVEGVLDALGRRVLRQWAGPEEVAVVRRTLVDVADRVVDAPELQVTALRVLATHAEDADAMRGWLADERVHGVPLPADERWLVLRRLAELGALDDALVEQERARDRSAIGGRGALRARAARPTAEAKAAAWQQMTDPATSNRDYEALAEGFWSLDQTPLLEEWTERYLAESPALAAVRGPALTQEIGRAFPFLPRELPDLHAVRDRLAAALAGELPTVLRRSWNDRLDDLDVAIAVRAGTPGRAR